MRETELEKVMLQFVRDEADVLVSHHDHRKRPGYPAREHDHHQSRRPHGAFRAVPAPRARGPLQPARLRLSAGSAGCAAHVDRTPAARGAERIQRPGRGIPHRRARSGIARRGESAGTRAARAHRSSRIRHVLPDDGASCCRAEGRSRWRRSGRQRSTWARKFAFRRNTSRARICG